MNSLLHKNITASKLISFDKAKLAIQPKLTINTPGDIYEQEADAMADRVMWMSSNETEKPVTGLIGKSLQRKCAHCEDEEKRSKPIMRKAEAGSTGMSVSSSFAAYLNASKGGGSPLPQGTRSFMENAFSADFSSVNIHTDDRAAEMSKGINARAFTTGNDIYFKSGEYIPNSEDGKKLLAHELTNVLQQRRTISANNIQRQTTASSSAISSANVQRGPNPSLCLLPLCSAIENPSVSCMRDPHTCAQSWMADVISCINANATASNASHAIEIIANTQQELTNYISYMNSLQPVSSTIEKGRYFEWLNRLCLSKQRDLFIEFHHNVIFDNVPTSTSGSRQTPWGYNPSDWDEIEQAMNAIPDEHLWGRSSLLPLVHFSREIQHPSGSSIGGETDPNTGEITIYNQGIGSAPMGRSVGTGVSTTNQTIRHEVGHLVENTLSSQLNVFFQNIIGWYYYPVSFLITNPPASVTHRNFQNELCTELQFLNAAGECDHARLVAFIDSVPLNASLISNTREYTKTTNLFMSWPVGSVPSGPEFSYARTSPSDYFSEIYSLAVSNPEFIHSYLPINQVEWLKQNVFYTRIIFDELIMPYSNLATVGNEPLLNRYQMVLQLAQSKFTRQQLEPISQQLQLLLMQIKIGLDAAA